MDDFEQKKNENPLADDRAVNDHAPSEEQHVPLQDHSEIVNVSEYLKRMAQTQPYKRAVVQPVGWDDKGRIAYTHFTFLQLEQESDYLAHGLENAGITRGTRTILMARPSLEFFALTFK